MSPLGGGGSDWVIGFKWKNNVERKAWLGTQVSHALTALLACHAACVCLKGSPACTDIRGLRPGAG